MSKQISVNNGHNILPFKSVRNATPQDLEKVYLYESSSGFRPKYIVFKNEADGVLFRETGTGNYCIHFIDGTGCLVDEGEEKQFI